MARFFLLPFIYLISCSTSEKPYTHYLINPEVVINKSLIEDKEKPIIQDTKGGDRTIKARWNDGTSYTEVDIPVLSSGQRVIIEHASQRSNSQKNGPDIILPAPTLTDSAHRVMQNAYLARGLAEDSKAPEISLSQARLKLDEAIRSRNYTLALSIIEKTLARYPSHPEFLRAKGSVLLLIGEKEQALSVYEQAQDIEFDPSVERKIKQLDQ